MPVIDFHNHVGRYGHLAMDDDPERFVRIMDAAGVDRACVFCIWYGDARRANDMTARLVATHPGRFIGAAYVTPNYPEEMLPELERAFYMPGMKYVKLYPAYHAGRVIDDPVFFPVFEWADERGLAVMSHHNDWPQPLRYVGLAKRYPNVRWVIAHAGNGPMAQEEAVQAARSADKRLPGGVDLVGRTTARSSSWSKAQARTGCCSAPTCRSRTPATRWAASRRPTSRTRRSARCSA